MSVGTHLDSEGMFPGSAAAQPLGIRCRSALPSAATRRRRLRAEARGPFTSGDTVSASAWLRQGVGLTPVNIFNRAAICLFVAICRFIRVIGAKRRFLTGSR
jgi:hypothetical protein